MQRIDKILSEAGVASRKELKAIIRAGRVCVNGNPVRTPEEKFDASEVHITVDGMAVRKRRPVLLMLHKPAGYVTSTNDPRDRTVMELIPEEYKKMEVKPVGRLDKETEGLLLFTNDGDLCHHILSPKKLVWKVYYVEHDGTADEEDVSAFSAGLVLKDGTQCLPATLTPQGDGKSLVRVCEGKYHQVRRMMASRGMHVRYLRRIAEGNIQLASLPVGQVQELTLESPDVLW